MQLGVGSSRGGGPGARRRGESTSLPVALDPGLRALVRLSAALVLAEPEDLDPFLATARDAAVGGEVEEALLQSYLFGGYPMALNALARWRALTDAPSPPRGEGSWDEWAERGRKVCREVYGSAYPGLRTNIARLSVDLDEWMVVEGYGKVLGRPGLELWRRECCIVAMLVALGTPRQLFSHLRGALRTGATPEVLDAVMDEVGALVGPRLEERAREVWVRVQRRGGGGA